MTKTIILELFQPFAQYRNPFTFFYGQSYPLPPKSTIIGMLQNITNNYYDVSFFDLQVSIHGGFESLFWNYQNLIKSSPNDIKLMNYKGKVKLWNQKRPLYNKGIKSQRSPVSQQELFNGHLFIFIKGKENIIENIRNALEKPTKIPYLGRSEDIFFLKNLYHEENISCNVSSVKNNIWLNQPSYMKLNNKSKDLKFPIKGSDFSVYSIPTKVLFKNNDRIIKNKLELRDSTRRFTEFETVIHTGLNQNLYLENEVKVEKYKINDERNLIFKIPQDYGWL
ncbi:type I-B CRISPR-associated protein Cas5b [Methanobrevibacter curvatus]|uniref:CRISPR-associated protein Cas5 n=1 Tax=Methanobrevibacter curvatus TaxID=49547 RepID=A0A166AHI6_9EURY|nr:type I-B CRISPR-associated protein Cas5b [Methanobrevibacter curvatus]KZX12041.1 CRISPR-associated protein Cas5 [Methanobrevibacter curvatus]